ncbi:MAG: nucleoside recognition domain-containing protein [Thermodesulfobacteriota bacterium]
MSEKIFQGLPGQAAGWSRSVLKEAGWICWKLFRIMIPVMVLVKILVELGWVSYLALPLEPVMELVGLPAEMGLVWATAMLDSYYSGIVVLLSLLESQPLTVAQMTVLGSMILICHALPVEVKIAQASGNRFLFQLVLRILGGFALGFLLHHIYAAGGWLQQENSVFWQKGGAIPTTLASWALNQGRNLLAIFLIILTLVVLMRILKRFGVIDLINRLLSPLLRILNIGREAGTLTIIGMTLGLSYGGGLIIHEAGSGRIEQRDVFGAMTMMGLAHGLIEDTIVLALLGAHLSGILFARILFALLAVALVMRIIPRLSTGKIHFFFYTRFAPRRADSAGKTG